MAAVRVRGAVDAATGGGETAAVFRVREQEGDAEVLDRDYEADPQEREEFHQFISLVWFCAPILCFVFSLGGHLGHPPLYSFLHAAMCFMRVVLFLQS